MRAIAVPTAFLLLAACAAAIQITPAEESAAKDAYTKCLFDNIARLDNGRTDPVSIAMGIQPACAAQYNTLIQIAINKCCTTENAIKTTQQNMKSEELKLITSAVLHYRAAKQDSKN